MGLVQYDSSDEEEDEQIEAQPEPERRQKDTKSESQALNHDDSPPQPPASTSIPAAPQTREDEPLQNTQPQEPAAAPQPEQQQPPLGPVLGPALGPARPPPQTDAPNQRQMDVDMSFLDDPASSNSPSASHNNSNNNEPPKSPYTIQRTLLRDLTLPAIDISTIDIPPSPPPSPSQSSSPSSKNTEFLSNLTVKFTTFLALKRGTTQQPTHFNQRLAASAMMRNPSLTDKMLGFVGVETEFLGPDDVRATEQYATTLPSDLWDPAAAFPDWAFKGMLRRAQERGDKERERARGEPVEFVSAGAGASGGGGSSAGGAGGRGGSRGGTPGLGGASASTTTGKRKSRFDV